MSAAIAMAPSLAPHDRSHYPAEIAHSSSSTSQPPLSTSTASPSSHRTLAPVGTPNAAVAQRSGSDSPRGGVPSASHKSSPRSVSRGPNHRVFVKKEPGSPDVSTSRHRPRRLDLSKNTLAGPATARPLTTRDALNVQEVGIACLSPGFVTKDPVMQEQLQRSMSVREQQRHLIEARLHQQSAKGIGDLEKDKDNGDFMAKTPGLSRRNKAPGLSIVAPSHEHFANERVIQSAPLGQTFTGMNKPPHLSRYMPNHPPSMSNSSHIHHVPAAQMSNRLPPITDVLRKNLGPHSDQPSRPSLYPGAGQAPMPSPGHPPPPPAMSARPREFKSAEEAQVELAGGRPELLPNARRRTRAEYEEGMSPPLGTGPTPRRTHYEERRDIPDDIRKRKDEFMSLVSRAWDLFHAT